MIDGVNDEVTDALDTAGNVLMMEGSRVIEAVVRWRAEMMRVAADTEREDAKEARNRLRVDAAQSRMRLQPVMSDRWWAGASVESITKKYEEAKAWEPLDSRFTVYVERIEEEAKALHDMDPHQLMDKVLSRTESQLAREQTGPMTVDEARAAAMHTPAWYKVHEELATDLTPYHRQAHEMRLVEDMTQYRDTGRLQTDSAKREWARYTDHPTATMVQDENESMSEFLERRTAMVQEHWDHTVEDRANIGKHHEDVAGAARPMAVAEAREFMEEFAPEWFKAGHNQLEHAAVSWEPGQLADHRREMNDQMRYAMEHLRDTGTLEHSYARSMRDTMGLDPKFDTTDGGKTISMADRVRFGGSELARPLTYTEATRLINFAPDWYQGPVMGALGEGTMLSPSQRAGQADALVSDMTRLRDYGVLDTDHAMRVWAAQQPAAVDPIWGESLPVKSIWADTVEARQGPAEVPQEVREAVGVGVPGKPRHSAREGVLGVDDHHPKVDQEPAKGKERATSQEQSQDGPAWDSARARVDRARELRERGFNPEEIRAQMLSDWNTSTPPGSAGTGRVKGKSHAARHHAQTQEATRKLSR